MDIARIVHAVTGLLAKKATPRGPLISPARDWLIALLGALMLLAALGSVAAYFFFQPKHTVESVSGPAESVSYDRTIAARVIADFRAKKARYDALSESVARGAGEGVK